MLGQLDQAKLAAFLTPEQLVALLTSEQKTALLRILAAADNSLPPAWKQNKTAKVW